jgi:hypothetical protein
MTTLATLVGGNQETWSELSVLERVGAVNLGRWWSSSIVGKTKWTF